MNRIFYAEENDKVILKLFILFFIWYLSMGEGWYMGECGCPLKPEKGF